MARKFDSATPQYFANTSVCPIANYPFTVAGWAKQGSGTSQTLICFGKTGVTDRHLLYFNSSSVSIFSGSGGSFGQASVVGAGASVWQHVGGVLSASNSRTAYSNGSAGTTDATNIAISGFDRVYLGAYYNNGLQSGFYQDGDMAEWGVWDVALTAGEMSILAQGFSPLMVRPEKLVAYFPLHGQVTNEEDWAGHFPLTNTGGSDVVPHPRIIYPMQSIAPIVGSSAGGGAVARRVVFCAT